MNPWKRGTHNTHHAHLCDNCGLVWDHDPVVTDETVSEIQSLPRAEFLAKERQNTNAHTCIQCGEKQYWVYNGDESSLVENDGINPKVRD